MDDSKREQPAEPDDTAEFPAANDPDADANGYGIWTGDWWERPYQS
jgi:hypothetical protein